MFGKNTDNTSIKQPPVEKIKVMSKMGIGEKEIVKQLKSEGYSFSEIENAMMSAMKEGIEASVPQQYAQQQYPQQTYPQPEPMAQKRTQQEIGLTWPRLERPEELFPESGQEELSPEVAMEDLIENITYGKLEVYNQQLKRFADSISKFEEKIKQFEEKTNTKPVLEMPKEYDERLENIEAKINGLEKAFRQMLPSLTKNIEELRNAIDSMKSQSVVAKSTIAPNQQIYEKYYPNVPLFPTNRIEEKQEA